jgi:hypothetical protein
MNNGDDKVKESGSTALNPVEASAVLAKAPESPGINRTASVSLSHALGTVGRSATFPLSPGKAGQNRRTLNESLDGADTADEADQAPSKNSSSLSGNSTPALPWWSPWKSSSKSQATTEPPGVPPSSSTPASTLPTRSAADRTSTYISFPSFESFESSGAFGGEYERDKSSGLSTRWQLRSP